MVHKFKVAIHPKVNCMFVSHIKQLKLGDSEKQAIRVCTGKLIFFISQPKHMLWVLIETVLLSAHMLKIMCKKIFKILC